ncbi:MAG: CRISPR-associated helicase Cas3' [Fuerstiella sp.]
MKNFSSFFRSLTDHPESRQWQADLAADGEVRSRLVRRVTGDGKTEGVLSAWAWNALANPDEAVRTKWPRRLVWCLPMRVLVEQTVAVAESLCEKMPEHQRPKVGVLMGGEDMEEWFLEPHRPWILIGTQDMLLSRAMNRGYASGRARWPVEFGLLNQDALWVMDEVQLMDVGLATSAQLQAYRDQDAKMALRPAYTWWMSATLQPDWLKTVDTDRHHADWISKLSVATADERQGGLWEVKKYLTIEAVDSTDHKSFATRILEEHAASEASDYGHITLVVCNTVDRAVATYTALTKGGDVEDVRLVHSRFRQAERKTWREDFLNRAACRSTVDRIIVATQVVEAGVDISATCLVTELAPWPSLVQRFGRCSRYGGAGRVFVIDRGHDEKTSAPYEAETLTGTLSAIQLLTDVGIRSLEEFEERLDADARAGLYPYDPQHLLMRNEFDELFDTTPDLTGADLDISRFIRSGDERDLQVFWAGIPAKEDPDRKRHPQRRELCSVPFLKARDWLCGSETKSNRKPKLRKSMRAWVWDWLDGEWKEARREDLLPGRTVCVDASCGGYTLEQGFSPDSSVFVSPPTEEAIEEDHELLDLPDEQHDSEALSVSEWKSIAFHSDEVVDEVEMLSKQLELPEDLCRILKLAARWHDVGKSHAAFQGAIKDAAGEDRPDRVDLAKGPNSAWRKPPSRMYRFETTVDNFELRPTFRHELASALALFTVLRLYQPDHAALLGPWQEVPQDLRTSVDDLAQPAGPPTPEIQQVLNCTAEEFNLLVYLVGSHHGKVRVALHASPADQNYTARFGDQRGLPIRGIRNDDVLPAIAISGGGQPQPKLPLSLEPAAMGLSPVTGASWRERCQGLIARYSPATLATLEAILRAADVAASRRTTEDIEFVKAVNS